MAPGVYVVIAPGLHMLSDGPEVYGVMVPGVCSMFIYRRGWPLPIASPPTISMSTWLHHRLNPARAPASRRVSPALHIMCTPTQITPFPPLLRGIMYECIHIYILSNTYRYGSYIQYILYTYLHIFIDCSPTVHTNRSRLHMYTAFASVMRFQAAYLPVS